MLYAAGLSNESGTTYTGSVPIRVVNLSLGSTGGGCGSSYRNSIQDVTDAGITVVSSSGNEAQEAPGAYGYPASCDNVISVAATAATGLRAYYSTYNDAVDIAAPGGDVGADVNADGYSDGVLAFDSDEDLAKYKQLKKTDRLIFILTGKKIVLARFVLRFCVFTFFVFFYVFLCFLEIF